ncbi:MAG TPA: sigma-70 family RNA polymerase sigma factor [Dehalococcoidia bacterium]|nr:sigma-70 family RNA polymerase sigma factor [Dehalococcoidia bacterium]
MIDPIREHPEFAAPEDGLVEGLRAYNDDAWSELFALFHPLVYRYFRAHLLDDDAAAEGSSSVFVEATRHIHRYRGDNDGLLPWLFDMAAAMLRAERGVSRERRGRPRSHRDSRDERSAALITRLLRPAEDRTTTDPRAIRHALGSLRDDEREMILLRFSVGLPPEQVARVLRISIDETYLREARALISLQRAVRALP